MKLSNIPYFNYPNPTRRRKDFLVLDGKWQLTFKDCAKFPEKYEHEIIVPYTYETRKSGINKHEVYKSLWYYRTFEYKSEGTTLLHFLAVDYECSVYINRQLVGKHVGGVTSFYFDISQYIVDGLNEIHIKVNDSLDGSQIRGKQRARPESYECWYVQTTGIWKSVYLESAGTKYVTNALVNGDALGNLRLKINFNNVTDATIRLHNSDGTIIKLVQYTNVSEIDDYINVENIELWDITTPVLYNLLIETHGSVKDIYNTYVGFRSINTVGEQILINNKPTYLRMILNQGYHPESGLSTYDRASLLADFQLMKEMGFNGARLHQKIEDPFFYYLADFFGLYLWAELPSAYSFDAKMRSEISGTVEEFIMQNYESPAIIAYVLFNESWGIPQINDDKETQAFVAKMYQKAKHLDDSRLIITNDGWFQTRDTELVSLHEYEQDPNLFSREYVNKNEVLTTKIINKYGTAFAQGHVYKGQPILITEFGGIALTNQNGWGYGNKANGLKSLQDRITKIFSVIDGIPYLAGFCYTQYSDVEQETNGLVYANRQPKIAIKHIREIVERTGRKNE